MNGGRTCVAAVLTIGLGSMCASAVAAEAGEAAQLPAGLRLVLDVAQPLKYPRGDRLPLYLWPAMNPGVIDEARAEQLVRELDARGVGLVCDWSPGNREASLAAALPIAKAQKKLGRRVNINATGCLSSFFNGEERTAHIDDADKPFWDTSFGKQDMGCPFALDSRKDAIREQVVYFAEAYRREGVPVDFVFADWEIDGPIEWNGAWEASRRCKRCRERIPEISNFLEFQRLLRGIRSELQRYAFARPILERSPQALVGNYAVYQHDGFRYWYDYFENDVGDSYPVITDQKARYRHWANEFEGTGYTFAMPVVYPWEKIFHWYDFSETDYRWFYNMLLVASNVGQHTPRSVPIISFVHWHTVQTTGKQDPGIKQMSEWAYQELLWHMLLRGTDTFFLWCAPDEQRKEVELLHPVWAAAQQFGEFLDKGVPVSFDVPRKPGSVISGLRLGERVLVRRTDFRAAEEVLRLDLDEWHLRVPPLHGRCQIIPLEHE